MRRRLAAAALFGFVLASAGAALAFWTITAIMGSGGYASAQVNTLGAPTSGVATANGANAVTFSWTNPASQLTGAQNVVTRTAGPGSPTTVCTVATTVNSCQDTGLQSGTTYSYKVQAFLGNWLSAQATGAATTASPTFEIVLAAGPYTAGSPITITSLTAKLGGVTDTTYTGAKTITWSGLASSPGGNVPVYPSSSQTFVNGVASPGSVTAFNAGSNTLTATDSAASSITGSITFTVVPAAPSALAFTPATPGPGTAGTAIPNVAVSVKDAYGNVTTSLNSGSVTVSIKAGSAQAAFTSGTTTTPVSSGVATFTNLVVNTAGLYALTAAPVSISGVSATVDSGQFSVVAAAAAKFAFTTSPVSGQASTSATLGPITVQLQDAFNNPKTAGAGGQTVNLSSNTTGTAKFGATSGGTGVTSVVIPNGSNSVNFFYADTKVGSPTITASFTGLTSATQAETITPAAAASIAFSPSAPSSATAGTAITNVAVVVRDAFGNAVTTQNTGSITVSIASGPQASFSSGTTNVNVASGQATFTNLVINTAGTYTLTATPSGISGVTTPVTSGSFTVTAAAASKLVFTSSAVSGAGSTTANLGPITVQRLDAFNNPVTTGSTTVGLSSNTSGTAVFSATLNGTGVTSVTIAAGNSTASFFYGDTSAGSPTITASSGGLTSGTQTETITSSVPTKLAITSTAVSGAARTARTLGPITVTLQDANGNPVNATGTGTTVNLTSNSTGTFSFAAGNNGTAVTSVTIPAGSSSVQFWYSDTKAGTPTITASSPGLTSATQAETITAGPASALCFVATSSTTCVTNTTLGVNGSGGTFTGNVQLTDAFGNPVNAAANITVAIAASGDITSFSPSSVTINAGSSLSNFLSATLHNGTSKSGTLTGTSAPLTQAQLTFTNG